MNSTTLFNDKDTTGILLPPFLNNIIYNLGKDIAIEKDASDIHLIAGIKPRLRIVRSLEEIEKYKPLTAQDMYDALKQGIVRINYADQYYSDILNYKLESGCGVYYLVIAFMHPTIYNFSSAEIGIVEV